MSSDFQRKKVGDVIGFGPKRLPHRVVRYVGSRTVVLQEMSRDRLGRLRSIGEEGRFSTTPAAVYSAPLYQRGGTRR